MSPETTSLRIPTQFATAPSGRRRSTVSCLPALTFQKNTTMPQISKIALVGRGLIGSSWALVFARSGLNVRIWNHGEADTAIVLGRMEVMIKVLQGTGLEGDPGTLARISAHASLESAPAGAD